MSSINNNIFVSKIDGEDEELVRENYKNQSFKRFNGFVLRSQFEEYADRISKINVRDGDIWVCSHPKTGCTWTQEMVWCIANNFDLTTAEKPLSQRTIFLDLCFILPSKMNETYPRLIEVNKLLSKTSTENSGALRIIKTHLPYEFLPENLKNGSTKAKIIHVARNPRDTCISSFHYQKFMGRFVGSLEDFCDIFMRGLVPYGPYLKNVLTYWHRRQDDNLLFLKYEDMKTDLPSVIKKTASFLGINSAPSDECMNQLCQHLSFNSMKKNFFIDNPGFEMANKVNQESRDVFLRKGETEQWKKDFSAELIERFEKWEKENFSQDDFSQTIFL